MVPSFSNLYWNAGVKHEVFGLHVWTMGLAETDRSVIANIPFYIDIDMLLKKYLWIEIAEYCGEDCILILASKINKRSLKLI